ncbi:MAG TPA: hypothetical protein VKR53_20810 [Puia sp.]|nr:hypothetical protein [Puia sp.]
MKTSVYTKIFVLALVIFSALALVSYSRSKTTVREDCSNSGKCNTKKIQSELMIWETFSKNLLSVPDGSDDE